MKLTCYGHSCFSVFAGGKTLLFDPFVTPNPLAKAINIDKIEADYIFVSHAHYDHMTDLLSIAKRTGAKVLAGWELFLWCNNSGLTNTHPINPGGEFSFDFGDVKSVIAQHSSSFSDGSYGGVASGFVFRTTDGNFYYSGDTGLTIDMQLIPDWATLDFAVLPIGDGLTMGVTDAIKAADFVKVKNVVGVHYDTFDYIKMDHQNAINTFKNAGMELHLPPIGGSIEL
ncbi:MAG: metal-dependent hydrolase [Chitinophagaceae bacterium]